jgi:lysophospholipase L1-like esterase
MKNIIFILTLLFFIACNGSSGKSKKIVSQTIDLNTTHQIFIIGDSTVNYSNDHKDVDHKSRVGWGEVIGEITKGKVYNRARGGASARAFRFCPRPKQHRDDIYTLSFGKNLDLDWDGAKSVIDRYAKKGDYLFIQFGANDEHHYGKAKNCGFGAIHGVQAFKEDYKKQLKYYINEARKKGMIPVLITPINPRHYKKSGDLQEVREPYVSYTKEVAAKENVIFLDLFSKSVNEFNKLQCNTGNIDPYGPCEVGNKWNIDSTHLLKGGALKVAGWVKELACQKDSDLCAEFK